jgi:hypothetical protein
MGGGRTGWSPEGALEFGRRTSGDEVDLAGLRGRLLDIKARDAHQGQELRDGSVGRNRLALARRGGQARARRPDPREVLEAVRLCEEGKKEESAVSSFDVDRASGPF